MEPILLEQRARAARKPAAPARGRLRGARRPAPVLGWRTVQRRLAIGIVLVAAAGALATRVTNAAARPLVAIHRTGREIQTLEDRLASGSGMFGRVKGIESTIADWLDRALAQPSALDIPESKLVFIDGEISPGEAPGATKLTVPFAILILVSFPISRYLPVPALWAGFIVGWILQFVGHIVYEKKSPAFFTNVRQLLVGPLWIIGTLGAPRSTLLESPGKARLEG